jgi:ligand-binding sensor protein
MELTDYMAVDDWVALQNELHERYGLNADVMNKDGVRLAGNTWGNTLCKAIREDEKGFGAICATAGQAFKQKLQMGREPFCGECDAGMMRICVPVLKDGELIGAVGGCGLMPEGGEIEEEAIDMMSDINAGAISRLLQH